MLNGFINVTVSKDLTEEIRASLEELKRKTVCIGVPQEENAERKAGKDSTITNAQLVYVHTNGVRNRNMINLMQHNLDSGMPYSKAHEMYVHENGSPLWDIPPRPILQPAIENSKEQLAELMKLALLDALNGKNVSVSLMKVGMQGQNAARAWFTDPSNGWAENSKNTIHMKGSDRPLINTGELRKSIIYVIKDGDRDD